MNTKQLKVNSVKDVLIIVLIMIILMLPKKLVMQILNAKVLHTVKNNLEEYLQLMQIEMVGAIN